MTTLALELDDQIFHQLESYAHHSKQNIQEAIQYLLLNQLDITNSAPKKRQFGQLKGLVVSMANDFNAPLDDFIDAGYRAMAQDKQREADAKAWCEGLILSS